MRVSSSSFSAVLATILLGNAFGQLVPVFEQCGGEGYDGPTECAEGARCLADSKYWSACLVSCTTPGYECWDPVSQDRQSCVWLDDTQTFATCMINEGEQCAGTDYTGLSRCIPGTECTKVDDTMSKCLAPDVPVETTPSSPSPSPVVSPVRVSPVRTSPMVLSIVPSPVEMSPSPVRMSPSPVRMSPSPVRMSPSPVRMSPSPVRMSPSPVEMSPSPVRISPVRTSPVRTSPAAPPPVRTSPAAPSPVRTSPAAASPVRTSPMVFSIIEPPPVRTSPAMSRTSPAMSRTSPRMSPTPLPPSPQWSPRGGRGGWRSRWNNWGDWEEPSPSPTRRTSPSPSPMKNMSGCASRWEQCGGKGYDGPTCCPLGFVCEVDNEWYSGCKLPEED